MTDSHPSAPTRLYSELEATLAGTAQGRDFLQEHARRTRKADTQTLLDAIARLEAHIGIGQPRGDVERLRGDLAEMTDVFRRARIDLAGMAPDASRPDPLSKADAGLDWIAASAERATSEILDATEKVQETAWTMRESGFSPSLCDHLDRHANEIYAACTSHDLTAQRIARVVSAFAVLEERIGAVDRVWGMQPPNAGSAPPLDVVSAVLSNDDIDFVRVEPDMPAVPAAGPAAGDPGRASPGGTPASDPASDPDGREAALAELRRMAELGTRDKLRLFT